MPAPKVLDDETKAAVKHAVTEFTACMTTPLTTSRQRYLRELVAVTRAAAIGGDYVPAIKGYELLGKALGHVTENQNHLHIHQNQGGDLVNATDAELVELLSRKPQPNALPAPTGPDLLPAIAEAEAEVLLFA